MDTPPPPVASRTAHRSLISAFIAVASFAAFAAAGGCANGSAGPADLLTQDDASIGSGGTTSTATSGKPLSNTTTVSNGVTNTATSGNAANGVGTTGGGTTSGGTVSGNGGTNQGGNSGPVTSTSNVASVNNATNSSSATTGEVEKPCEDLAPPEMPDWPGATCTMWATETPSCNEEWFAEFCDISCGRCVPEGGLPPVPTAPDCSGEGLPNVVGGDGFATRYWDCCQPHCSQFDGHRCSQDGTSQTGDSNSACNGGGSFACYDEAPRAVSECLSYGHMAKTNPNCGGCYRIQFTGEGEHNVNDPGSRLIKGKQMIVKVTNTGGDVAGNQFDLMIPGGGVGQFNACSRQWGTSDLGAQYGGFLSECTGDINQKKECVRQECMKIPAGSARDGCIWFVDWFQVADNPKFTSEQTNCPF